jgi:HPt (histidine-containing phosphotransfer) domain-containing protein
MSVDDSISQREVATIRHKKGQYPRRREKSMDAAQRLSGFNFALKTGGDGASACPIDLVHLARQTMGDNALEAELLALFDRQAGQIAEKLRRADSDAATIFGPDLAHKLKGSARTVGAHEVASAAENYEHCASKGILRDSDSQRLIEAVEQVRAALRELRAELA